MKGYVMTRYGNAQAMKLQEVPQPNAGDGEVLIRVRAAGLNPVDYKLRQPLGRLVWPLDLPVVAGSELSGVVESIVSRRLAACCNTSLLLLEVISSANFNWAC